MILRKASNLEVGDTIVTRHNRYDGIHFEITAKSVEIRDDHSVYVCKTKATGLDYGPEIVLRIHDMVEVTPE